MSWPKKIDFEAGTNPYPGAATDPQIVAGGQNSSSYAMGGGPSNNKSWHLQDSTYDWVSEVKAVSFWHRPVAKIGGSNGDIPAIFMAHPNDTRPAGWDGGSWFYLAMDLAFGASDQYYAVQQQTSLASKWYINGVEVVESGGDKIASDFIGDIYFNNVTVDTWYHHYIEFNVTMKHFIFMNDYAANRDRYKGTGKLDDLYFFNESQTTDTISNLSNNTFGISPYPGISFTDVSNVSGIDLTSTDVVAVSSVPTTWFDNLVGSGDTLEKNKETRRNNLIDTIFTANSTKTFFDISKSVINLPTNSIKESTRIFKVDSTSNKATINLNTNTALGDKKGFYVPLADNQKVDITSKDGNITFQLKRTGTGSDGKATYTVTKTAGTANLLIDS